MNICFIGDIVGRPGRNILKECLPKIREEYAIDLVVANSENASHGFGLTKKNADELFKCGIDVMTGGNHTWDKSETVDFIGDEPRLLRPINYPDTVPGRSYGIFKDIGVINVMGQFSLPPLDNPFIKVNAIVNEMREQGIKNIVVDFHAESTAEKRAMYLILQDRVSAVLGTHTHISTDDLTVEKGSLYISDVGLTGCRDGVIGIDKEKPIQKFLTGMPVRFDVPSKCKRILQAVIFSVEEGKVMDAKKLKIYDDYGKVNESKAFFED